MDAQPVGGRLQDVQDHSAPGRKGRDGVPHGVVHGDQPPREAALWDPRPLRGRQHPTVGGQLDSRRAALVGLAFGTQVLVASYAADLLLGRRRWILSAAHGGLALDDSAVR